MLAMGFGSQLEPYQRGLLPRRAWLRGVSGSIHEEESPSGPGSLGQVPFTSLVRESLVSGLCQPYHLLSCLHGQGREGGSHWYRAGAQNTFAK